MGKRAFTLVELLIVIIIISVLATIAIPKVNESWRRASESSLRSRLKIYRDAMDRFYADCGCYPHADHVGLQSPPATCYTDYAFGTRSLDASTWNGPYLRNQEASNENRFLHPHYRGLQIYGIAYISFPNAKPKYVYILKSSSGTVYDLNGKDISTW